MWRSDEELMLSYRDGDDEAFEILYRRYEKPVLNFIYRLVMSASDVEELCQETFFRVARGKKKYKVTAKFKTWLFQIALNLCRDRLRRMKHRSHLSLNALMLSQDDEYVELQELISHPSSADPMKQVETGEQKAMVQQAIVSLPEEQRLVVIMREYHGLKFSEIADIMDCPVGTVKSHNYRARAKLKEVLAEYMNI